MVASSFSFNLISFAVMSFLVGIVALANFVCAMLIGKKKFRILKKTFRLFFVNPLACICSKNNLDVTLEEKCFPNAIGKQLRSNHNFTFQSNHLISFLLSLSKHLLLIAFLLHRYFSTGPPQANSEQMQNLRFERSGAGNRFVTSKRAFVFFSSVFVRNCVTSFLRKKRFNPRKFLLK